MEFMHTFENRDKAHICFFSYENFPNDDFHGIIRRLAHIINAFYDMGYTHFIVGSKTNFDLLVIDFLLHLKERDKEVKIEMVYGCKYPNRKFKQKAHLIDKITPVSHNSFEYDITAIKKYINSKPFIVDLSYPNDYFKENL